MRACHTALWCHLTPHKHPKATLGQTGHVENVPTVHLGLAPLKTAPASSPRGPARRMSTASPALSRGLDVIFEAHHAQHRRDTTATRGRFRGAGQVSAAYWGPAPSKTALDSPARGPARRMSTASPALCHGLDVIFKAHHAKHGRDPTATQGQPRGAEHVPAVHLGPAPTQAVHLGAKNGKSSGKPSFWLSRTVLLLQAQNRTQGSPKSGPEKCTCSSAIADEGAGSQLPDEPRTRCSKADGELEASNLQSQLHRKCSTTPPKLSELIAANTPLQPPKHACRRA